MIDLIASLRVEDNCKLLDYMTKVSFVCLLTVYYVAYLGIAH